MRRGRKRDYVRSPERYGTGRFPNSTVNWNCARRKTKRNKEDEAYEEGTAKWVVPASVRARRVRHRRAWSVWTARRAARAVDQALRIVEKLEHRAGKDADGSDRRRRGHPAADPPRLFREVRPAWALSCPRSAGLRRGRCSSCPQDALKRAQAKKMLEIIVPEGGAARFWAGARSRCVLEVLGQRARGLHARASEQCFIAPPGRSGAGARLRPAAVRGAPRVRAEQRQRPMSARLSSRTHRVQGHVPGEPAAARSIPTCRTRTISQRHRHGTLPLFHQHQSPAGSARTPTA